MENPATWNAIQKLIHKTIRAHNENMRSEDPHIGFSLVTQIYLALNEQGYLNIPVEIYKQEHEEEGYYSR